MNTPLGLDEFDFIPFRSVDKGDFAVSVGVGAVGEGVAEFGGVLGEGGEIGYFEGEVGQVGSDDDRSAFVKFADFDHLLALGGFQKDELGTPARCGAANFFEPEHLFIKGDGFFQVGNPVTCMKQFGDHLLWQEVAPRSIREGSAFVQ